MLHGVSQFFVSSLPPKENYRLNILESTGNALLFPLASCFNFVHIKHLPDENNVLNIIKTIAIGILTLPLTIIGTILKGVGRILPHAYIDKTDACLTETDFTNPYKIQQCYDLAAILSKICLKNYTFKDKEIPLICTCSGTALGQVRHGGITPWDDDVDLVVFQENEKQFLKLEKELNKEGIKIDKTLRFDSTYKLRFSDEKIKEKYGYCPSSKTTGAVDIFIWSKMNDDSYTFDKVISRARWPQEFFSKEDIKNGFELRFFGPDKILLPTLKDPIPYLKRHYGENCLTHAISTHGHINLSIGPLKIQMPFFKLGAFYFRLEEWKGKCAQGTSPKELNLETG